MITLLAAASEGNIVDNITKTFGLNMPFFIAQLVNFILVILVLKKFAFGPIQKLLEERRARIASGEEKLKLIERQLADSVEKTSAAIAQANEEAVRMVAEAKSGAASFTEQKTQEAIASAQQIIAKAEAAAKAEREQLMGELKAEFGRLVALTTTQVTGKVLNDDDQRRINEAALTKVEG